MPTILLDNAMLGALPLHTDTADGVGVITGLGFTVNVLVADVLPQEPPDVVRVSVTVAGAEDDAV